MAIAHTLAGGRPCRYGGPTLERTQVGAAGTRARWQCLLWFLLCFHLNIYIHYFTTSLPNESYQEFLHPSAAHLPIVVGNTQLSGDLKTRLGAVTMSTRAPTTPPIVTGPLSVRIPSSLESGAFLTPDELSPFDVDFDASDYFMAEDARGPNPPSTIDIDNSITSTNEAHDARDTTTTPAPAPAPTAEGDSEGLDFTATTFPDPEDTSVLPPLTDRDDSSLLPLSSENGDHERGNNQTLIEEHEMRRKLMDMESSFLPEPSTIEVATSGPSAGADDTYLVGVSGGHDPGSDGQNESSQFSFITPSENHQDTEQDQTGPVQAAEREDVDRASAYNAQQTENESTFDSLASSPSAAATFRSGLHDQTISSETAPNASQFSHDGQSFRSQMSQAENESQLTPSKLGQSSRSISPGPARLFSDQSGSIASRRSSRPKYLTSRQSANRLSHSSITSSNTETTHSDATLGADFTLQSGGATPENWGSLNAGGRSHMTRTTSLGSMASGVSGYSEENPLDRRNATGPADGGLQTLEEESSPKSSRPAVFDEAGPVTPKAKPQSIFPSDTVITERVKDIQVPSTFVQKFREDHGNMGPSPEKRAGAATPAFGRSGRNMTLKEQSSTIDRLSKENFDLKMRIHFLNEALNKRSEEGIKEMISENVELKSDKVKLQKDNQGLRRKIRDLEKQVKDQQSDKDSMVNHDPEASEDDREPSHDGEVVFLRERVETYEIEIERLRTESIARETEKRRLAEIVKSLNENRTGGSEAGAREERVGFNALFSYLIPG